MAITMSQDMLPAVGDVVTKVTVDDDGRTADVHFKSGRWVAVHLVAEPQSNFDELFAATPEQREALKREREKLDAEE